MILLQYQTDIYPPYPEIGIEVTLPTQTDWRGPFPAFVDTGADMTIIPEYLLVSFTFLPIRSATLFTQWERGPSVHIVRVDIRLAGLIFPGVEIAIDPEGDEVVVGRNLLNYLDLRLQGPKQRLHILE
jgi:hypothetical protein